jgi:hypothetical protein
VRSVLNGTAQLARLQYYPWPSEYDQVFLNGAAMMVLTERGQTANFVQLF